MRSPTPADLTAVTKGGHRESQRDRRLALVRREAAGSTLQLSDPSAAATAVAHPDRRLVR